MGKPHLLVADDVMRPPLRPRPTISHVGADRFEVSALASTLVSIVLLCIIAF